MTSAITLSLALLMTTIGMAACSTTQGAPGPRAGVCSDEPVAAAPAEVATAPAEVAQPSDEPLAECGVAGAASSER